MIEYIVNKEKRTVVAMIKFIDEDGNYSRAFKDSNIIFDNLWMVLMHLKSHGHIWDKKYYSKANKQTCN